MEPSLEEEQTEELKLKTGHQVHLEPAGTFLVP